MLVGKGDGITEFELLRPFVRAEARKSGLRATGSTRELERLQSRAQRPMKNLVPRDEISLIR